MMLPTDVLVVLGGVVLLAGLALLLWRWRRNAVQAVIPPDLRSNARHTADPAESRMPLVRGKLLWLLVQRGSESQTADSTTVAPQVVAEAKALLARQHKIEAIRLVRERTGLGLKESRDFIDGLR